MDCSITHAFVSNGQNPSKNFWVDLNGDKYSNQLETQCSSQHKSFYDCIQSNKYFKWGESDGTVKSCFKLECDLQDQFEGNQAQQVKIGGKYSQVLLYDSTKWGYMCYNDNFDELTLQQICIGMQKNADSTVQYIATKSGNPCQQTSPSEINYFKNTFTYRCDHSENINDPPICFLESYIGQCKSCTTVTCTVKNQNINNQNSNQDKSTSKNGQTTEIVSGVIGVIAFVCILLCIYYCLYKQRLKRMKQQEKYNDKQLQDFQNQNQLQLGQLQSQQQQNQQNYENTYSPYQGQSIAMKSFNQQGQQLPFNQDYINQDQANVSNAQLFANQQYNGENNINSQRTHFFSPYQYMSNPYGQQIYQVPQQVQPGEIQFQEVVLSNQDQEQGKNNQQNRPIQ